LPLVCFQFPSTRFQSIDTSKLDCRWTGNVCSRRAVPFVA
jgi:hypothetical protein